MMKPEIGFRRLLPANQKAAQPVHLTVRALETPASGANAGFPFDRDDLFAASTELRFKAKFNYQRTGQCAGCATPGWQTGLMHATEADVVGTEVIALLDRLSAVPNTRPHIVVTNNVAIHTGDALDSKRLEWVVQELYLYYLPPYPRTQQNSDFFGSSPNTSGEYSIV